MGIDEDIDARLDMIEEQDNKAVKAYAEARRLKAMPFHLRIQEKSMKSTLERVHHTQRDTFQNICKKDKIHKEDWEDEFCLFWAGFLKGEYGSINDYLRTRSFQRGV